MENLVLAEPPALHLLDSKEINNPMMVVDDFFSADWLSGHLSKLKEWRNFVLDDTYYKDPRGCPSTLLFIYNINMKLIEAAWLLAWSDPADFDFASSALPEAEKNAWQEYPSHLEPTELRDPLQVCRAFFANYDIAKYREHLYEWLDCGLSAFPYSEDLYAKDLVDIYENLQKLYEACWVLLQRQKGTAKGKDHVAIPPTLDAIISMLKIAVKPEKIFLLKLAGAETTEDVTHFSLVLVIPEKSHMPFKDMEPLIELALSDQPFVHITLLKSHTLKEHLAKGHIFFSFTCGKDNLVFSEEEAEIPETCTEKLEQMVSEASATFEFLIAKAIRFKEMAMAHRPEPDSAMTAYMLQQATELTFRSVNLALSGFDPRSHSLRVLKKHNQSHLPLLNSVFSESSPEEASLCKILEEAYVRGRYCPTFRVPLEQLDILFSRVEELQKMAITQFADKMEDFNAFIKAGKPAPTP